MKVPNFVIKAGWLLYTLLEPLWLPFAQMAAMKKQIASTRPTAEGRVIHDVTHEEINHIASLFGPARPSLLDLYGEQFAARKGPTTPWQKLATDVKKMCSIMVAYDLKVKNAERRAFIWVARRLGILRRP